MQTPLSRLLTRRTLREFAGSASWGRGQAYYDDRRVRALTTRGDTVIAKVSGTHEYRVKLWVDGDELEAECSCPLGDEGAFCKHCVAVGLAWLAEQSVESVATHSAAPVVTLDDARAYLLQQNKEALVELLLAHAMEDERLQRRLLLQTAQARSPTVDAAAFRKAIDEATDAGDFVDYRSMREYAGGVWEVVGALEDVLNAGHSVAVVELAEYALTAVEHALGSVDDSAGHLGGIRERLEEIHHAACGQAKPDPELLAERLFNWQMRTNWDTFCDVVSAYADVFGKRGLARYRQLADAAWSKLSPLAPGHDRGQWDPHRARLTHIMESLAQQTGDLESLVAIKSKDLSHPYAFLQIAELYKRADQPDRALDWAERGWRTCTGHSDQRLGEFLADQYHRHKRPDEAMKVIWEMFVESPMLESYQQLRTHAKRCRQWPAWREKAFAQLRADIARRQKEARRPAWGWKPDYSELVRIFLWEKDSDAAWREAQTGGCTPELWLELAATREADHPNDALTIYRDRIEPLINQTNDAAYAEAARLLKKIYDLMIRQGQLEQFATYLAGLCATYKRKRNFIKLVNQSRLHA